MSFKRHDMETIPRSLLKCSLSGGVKMEIHPYLWSLICNCGSPVHRRTEQESRREHKRGIWKGFTGQVCLEGATINIQEE